MKTIWIALLALVLVVGLLACTGGDPVSSDGSSGEGGIAVTVSWGEGSSTTGNPTLCWASVGSEKTYTFLVTLDDPDGCDPYILDVQWCLSYYDGLCYLSDIESCDTSGVWYSGQTGALSFAVDFYDYDDFCFTDGINYYDGIHTVAVRVFYECSGSTSQNFILATQDSTHVCPVGSGCTSEDAGCL